MNYRKLGRSGLYVSEVALGGWLTQGRSISDETTDAIVRRAFELGVNFFDTADVYNLGAAEIALSKAIATIRRDDLVIATKCFFPMSDKPNDKGLSRKHIVESVHHSLRRLRTDYIDLMQFHRFDRETPLDETVRAIEDLVRQGKILYWGTSQWRAHDIVDLVHVAKQVNASRPISNQPVYNLFERGIEASVIPACEQFGLGQVCFSPLAQGVLTGKYQPGVRPAADSRAADDKSNQFMVDALTTERLSNVQNLKAYAESLGCTTGQLALAWNLRQPNVASVIVGATKVAQIEENVGASGLTFGPEVWERVEAIVEGNAEVPA